MRKVRVSVMANCDGWKSLCIEKPDGRSGTRVAGPKIYYDSRELCHFIVDADALMEVIGKENEEVDE